MPGIRNGCFVLWSAGRQRGTVSGLHRADSVELGAVRLGHIPAESGRKSGKEEGALIGVLFPVRIDFVHIFRMVSGLWTGLLSGVLLKTQSGLQKRRTPAERGPHRAARTFFAMGAAPDCTGFAPDKGRNLRKRADTASK